MFISRSAKDGGLAIGISVIRGLAIGFSGKKIKETVVQEGINNLASVREYLKVFVRESSC